MAAPAERPKQYHIVKAFRGLNTKANRTSIDQNEFSWLENAMPVGDSNLKIVPNSSNVTNSGGTLVSWVSNVAAMTAENVNLNDYIFAFETDGRLQAFNLTSQATVNIAAAATFNVGGAYVTQWKDERIIIGDPTQGLFSWDGNVLVSIGSVGFIGLTNIGAGYTSVPAVAISGPDDPNGTQAVAQATLSNGTVSSVFLTQPGLGYTNAANLTVTFSGGGGANATARGSVITFKTGTVQIVVASGGTGITNSAQVAITITGGGGTGAAAVPIVFGNSITSVVMTNPGQNYSNTANMSVSTSGGGISGAVLTPVLTTQPISDVATFSGRVWVSQGRTITYSAADSYNDFISVSAGNFIATDTTLHGNINALLSANNFLYWWGADSINVFSDVQVSTTTGATLFTNTNISASIGTDLINAIFPYFRSVLFMNHYGVYALVGSTTTKLSDALDGIFPLIDFTKPVTGGQVIIFNILCAAFNFYYTDPVRGTIPLQAVFFEKKWFLTNQGTINLMTSIPFSGVIRLYGTAGKNLVTLYTDPSAAIASNVQTALAHMGNPVRDKQATKFGLESTSTIGSHINATIDSESGPSPIYAFSTIVGWVNNSGQPVNWTNNSSVILYWIGGSGYTLYKSDAQQYGKYLGLTITSNSAAFALDTFEYEYEFGARF